MSIRKTVFIACATALCATSGIGPATMMGAAGAQRGDDGMNISVVDRRGRPMRLRALPEADQARVARLQESVRSYVRQESALSRVVITIRCSYPPLRCTITIVIGPKAS